MIRYTVPDPIDQGLLFLCQKNGWNSVYRNRKHNQRGVHMKNHLYNEMGLYRIVVAVLGLTVVESILGAIVLALSGLSTSKVIVALGLASVGGLTSLSVPPLLNR
jgi:hypothetical protein